MAGIRLLRVAFCAGCVECGFRLGLVLLLLNFLRCLDVGWFSCFWFLWVWVGFTAGFDFLWGWYNIDSCGFVRLVGLLLLLSVYGCGG